jgi:hypothetical protein
VQQLARPIHGNAAAAGEEAIDEWKGPFLLAELLRGLLDHLMVLPKLHGARRARLSYPVKRRRLKIIIILDGLYLPQAAKYQHYIKPPMMSSYFLGMPRAPSLPLPVIREPASLGLDVYTFNYILLGFNLFLSITFSICERG